MSAYNGRKPMQALSEVQHKFHWWISDRLAIMEHKNRGDPKPWSQDKTMQSIYMCNVRREDDKVTKWIRGVYEAFGHIATAEVNMIMARYVNKPESLAIMDWPWPKWRPGTWTARMSVKGAWGGAYIVSTNGRPMPKHEYIGGLLEHLWLHFEHHPLPSTLAGAHVALMRLQGLGSFMAAQVLADLKNTKGHRLVFAPDWQYFSAHGPGSLRGLGWYFDHRITPSMYEGAIGEAWVDLPSHLAEEVGCMQNLQNCFCEFDKYMRVSTGTGRSKRKYEGR